MLANLVFAILAIATECVLAATVAWETPVSLPEETVLVMLTISVEISSPALEASATAVWATSTASDDFWA